MHSLILAWASWLLALMLPQQQASVAFYEDEVTVAYPAELLADGPFALDEAGISYHYASLTEGDWLPLHEQLQTERRRLGLNDWLYAKLVHEVVAEMADFAGVNERRMVELHLLTLAGFDTRLCYDEHEVLVYVHTADELFEVPLITDGERRYLNLSAALSPLRSTPRSLRMHPLRPLPDGRALSTDLSTLPRLTPSMQERTLRFRFRDSLYAVQLLSDRTIARYMSDYPFFAEGRYVEAPMSREPHARLLAELGALVRGRSEAEALALLAAFTRGAFVYKEDKESFGYSKPMIPDEVLYYPVSDCEDRSALYFTLVRDLLDLPVVAIAYEDHLSVAVASDELTGRPFRHDGRAYYVCDPTGPKTSARIGMPPAGYERQSFEVVASYAPASSPQT